MNHAVDVGMFAENLVQGLFIVDINFVKLRPLAANEFDAVDDLF